MSRLLALLAAFVLLHDTAGNALWVARDHIVAVGLPFGYDPIGESRAGAKLTYLGGAYFYVKETPDEAVTALEAR